MCKLMKKVYGVRICKNCKGIVPEIAYRTKKYYEGIGIRAKYFCSMDCVKQYYRIDDNIKSEIIKKVNQMFLKDIEKVKVIDSKRNG